MKASAHACRPAPAERHVKTTFDTMKIRFSTRIVTLCFAIACLGICLVTGLGTYYFNQELYRATHEISSDWLPSVTTLSKIRGRLNQLRRLEARILLKNVQCERMDCDAALAGEIKALAQDEKNYEPHVTPYEERVLYEAYKRHRAIYLNIDEQMLARDRADPATFTAFLSESSQAYEVTTEALDQLIEFNSAAGLKAQAAVQQYQARSQFFLNISNTILAIALAVLLVRLTLIAIKE